MIHCDRLNNEIVFSDDRALLPPGFNDYIQQWLSEWQLKPWLMLREPFKYDPDYSGDIATLAIKEVCFQRQHWQLDNMRRLFRTAICIERDWQVIGSEIDPKTGHVVAPSPVVEVMVREQDQPPLSAQEWARCAAKVWVGLTDAEREQHPRIGQMADLLDLDTLL